FRRANGERRRSHAGDGKIRVGGCSWRPRALRRRGGRAGLSLPNRQTVDRSSSEISVIGNGTNHPGKAASALNEIKLFSLTGLARHERAGDACGIARWV